MVYSIRRFLLFYLLLSITIVSSITIVGTYFLNDAAIKNHLDTQLKQITHFLTTVISEKKSHADLKHMQKILNQKSIKTLLSSQEKMQLTPILSERFHFQIWNKAHELLLYSPHTADTPFSSFKNGFTNETLDEQSWRVYTYYDPQLEMTFMISESMSFRSELQEKVTWDNILILLWVYPLLGLLIWLIVGHALKSLKHITQDLSSRSATDFKEINLRGIPIEIKPLVEELNSLFDRLHSEFVRNRRFASDAAHELRTPLAALKTLTQLAMLSNSENERKKITHDMVIGIDRCTHVVQQLLTLSRLGREETLNDISTLNLSSLTAEVIAQLAPLALEKHIEISLSENNKKMMIQGNKTSLSILIRNIVDNAIKYTPENGFVEVSVFEENHHIILRVIDTGPGIPIELRSQIFERFFRILGNKATGCGLGLAIVDQIAQLHHAVIHLDTPQNQQGLQFDVIFKKEFTTYQTSADHFD